MSYVDHLLLQYAGEIGFISLGIGKTITSKYSIAALYGIVPAEISKGPHIETFTFKQTYQFTSNDVFNIYSGINVFHVTGVRYTTSKSGKYPNDYYEWGSIRGILYLGALWNLEKKGRTSFYLESGVNDISIVNYATNSQHIDPAGLFTLAIGYRYQFD